MTPFQRALFDRLRETGPITVEAYMAACNEYYYATRDPLGAAGDFTTAPEISQMFGELIGAALADAWQRVVSFEQQYASGRPTNACYVELGPGRGTLAADALRAFRRVGFDPAVHFVETSPVLREAQLRSVPHACHHESLESLPSDAPLLVVANEFLDALPIRQWVAGKERHVVLTGERLSFDCNGQVIEDSPARDALVASVASRLDSQGGIAIFIDYGHRQTSPGDTLQAMAGHRFASVLESPGEQDITSHVDFERVGEVAWSLGVSATRAEYQGTWLYKLGIKARAEALARAAPDRREEIMAAKHRLCHPSQMGKLFKVLALRSATWPSPAGL